MDTTEQTSRVSSFKTRVRFYGVYTYMVVFCVRLSSKKWDEVVPAMDVVRVENIRCLCSVMLQAHAS